MKFRMIAALLAAVALPALAQAAARPLFETKKVEGTDDVYIYRHGNHQSMFIVTSQGVIATDPIAYGKPEASVQYVAEIRKANERLAVLQDPNTPLADEVVGDEGRVIRLGGKIVELSYVGLNHTPTARSSSACRRTA